MGEPSSPPPLDPDNQFNFTCKCLSVHIVGHISPSTSIPPCTEPVDASSSSRKVYLNDRSEFLKQAAYVNWETDARPSRRKSTATGVENDEEEAPSGPAWRKCWICETRVYESASKRQRDDGVKGEWVTVDLTSGVIWGDVLNETLESDGLLPYSGLKLGLPSSSSSFGRPPNSAPPAIYPKVDEALANSHFISPVADPFFLPPPFIPSHPHLRNMCNEAVDYMREKHLRLEDEVREFIAKKSREMRDLEDKVRVEIEVLWKRYEEVPGVEGLERSRSRSFTRDEERDKRRDAAGRFTAAKSPTAGGVLSSSTNAPVGDITPRKPLAQSVQSIASPPGPGASSLLSASISAHSFHAHPPPPQVADKIDDSILTLSRTLDKRSDARAVAMSHVFSVFDDAMAGQAHQKRKESHSRTREPAKEAEPSPVTDRNAEETDSWIEEERKLLAATDGELAEAQEMDGRTPKPAQRKELANAKEKEKEKERRAVKFEEPSKNDAVAEDDAEDRDDADQDEYVFDFELDDAKKDNVVDDEAGDVPAPKESYISRTRNMVEANLSKTLAADAPSHRAAWRVIEQNSSIYHSMRRTSTDSLGSDTDSSTVSKLAMSMPMNIAAPRLARTKSELPDLQRKTSLTDREGILVPSLIAAMRQRGISSSNALGLSPANQPRPTREDKAKASQRRTARSGSASRDRDRERDTARSFAADPGAVFESMAEDAAVGSDDDDDGDGEQEGTLRESGFIPPHVLARRRVSQEGEAEVGWRSLATS